MNCDMCAYRVRLPGYEEQVGTPLSLAPPERAPRGWRARRAANQAAAEAAERRERPRSGLGRRSGVAGAAGPVRAPAVRGRRAGPPLPRRHRGAAPASTSPVGRASGWPSSAPTGRARRPWRLHLVGALDGAAAGGRGSVARGRAAGGCPAPGGGPAPGRARLPGPRRPAPAADRRGRRRAWARRPRAAPPRRWRTGCAAPWTWSAWPTSPSGRPQHLCLGERRRAALAGVLAAHPEILVLDEPSANLDPSARRDLVEIVGGLDLTTIVITHDLSLALELCPRSVVLDHGRVAADGPTRRSSPTRPAGRPPPGAALPDDPGGAVRRPLGAARGRRGLTGRPRRSAPPAPRARAAAGP